MSSVTHCRRPSRLDCRSTPRYARRSAVLQSIVKLKDLALSLTRSVLCSRAVLRWRFPDFDAATLDLLARVLPYTMTSPARVAAVRAAARYVDANNVPGAFVECGVWKGGSSMAAALTFSPSRQLFLFDTFEGMSAPGTHDRRAKDGADAATMLKSARKETTNWCYSPLDEVKRNMASTGYRNPMSPTSRAGLRTRCRQKHQSKSLFCSLTRTGTNQPGMNSYIYIPACLQAEY